MDVQVGQEIEFPFAKKTMKGRVVAVHPKSVVLRADFPNHRQKLVRRKLHELGAKEVVQPRKGFFARLRGK